MIINGQDKYGQSLLHLEYINVTNILLCFVLISLIFKYFTHFEIKLPHFVKTTMLSDNDSLVLK